jgi:hypothetical protein
MVTVHRGSVVPACTNADRECDVTVYYYLLYLLLYIIF